MLSVLTKAPWMFKTATIPLKSGIAEISSLLNKIFSTYFITDNVI